MNAISEAAAWIALLGVVVRTASHVITRKTDDSVKTDEWMRGLVDEQIAKRDAERTECAEQIRMLTGRLDANEEASAEMRRLLDECHDQHATAIAARHATHRELVDIRRRHEELRGIVDVITERPASSPGMEPVQ